MERLIQELVGVSQVGLVQAIEISIVLAAALAVVFYRLRQPAIPAYILAGFLLSFFARPLLGGAVSGMEQISHLGLVLLLFIIGLELDLKGLFSLGARTALVALLQAPVTFAALLGLQLLADLAGWSIPGLGRASGAWPIFAVAAALSSTAVVVRLLAEKFELATAAGKVTVVTLIAQDIWAVLALSLLFSHGESGGGAGAVVRMLLGAAVVAAVMFLVAARLLKKVMSWLARSPDLLAMCAMGWCFLGSGAMSALGLSAEMGALLAGLALGTAPGAAEILGKISNLRDFFLALFFIALGMSLPPPTWAVMGQAALLVLVVFLARMLLFAPFLKMAGLGPIVSISSSLNLAQLSEFSLLLIPVGLSSRSLDMDQAATIAYALMLSMLMATFLIRYNHPLALWAAARLGIKAEKEQQVSEASHAPADILLLGFFHNTEALARLIREKNPQLLSRCLVIDYNLKNHTLIEGLGLKVRYGDVSNPDTLRHFGLTEARLVICTISDNFLRGTSNLALARTVRQAAPGAAFVATAMNRLQVEELFLAGAAAAICPAEEAASAYLQAVEKLLAKEEK